MPGPFDHRLLFVSGKGGVGKTTVSLALGLLAVGLGKKVAIAEINSEEQIAHLLQRPAVNYKETQLLPGLWGINIDPKKSFQEYILLQIKFQSLYRAVFENKLVKNFIDATPGLAELMTIGKVCDLARHYDLVIVDLPSTGHGLGLLKIASVVSSAVKIGPLKTESDKIDQLLHDASKTQVVLVTLPEEMPYTEAVDMSHSLKEDVRVSLGPVILNQFHPDLFTPMEKKELKSLRDREQEDVTWQNPVWRAVDVEISRAEMSFEYAERLEKSFRGHPLLRIPFIFSREFGLPEIESIAEAIEQSGDVT